MKSNDIYINGTYLKNNPTWGIEDSVWKAKLIQKLLIKNNIEPKEITETGCGAGGILEALSKNFRKDICYNGYDISPQAISFAKEKETEKLRFFNENFIADIDISTDLLLVIDVIEHIDDYYGFLERLKNRSNYFVFHIPLDLSCRMVLKPHILLQQRESVGHIHYFTKEMVLWFLKDTGFEIIDWFYTKPVTDVKPQKGFSRGVKRILRNLSFKLNEDLSAKLWGSYSMMILAT